MKDRHAEFLVMLLAVAGMAAMLWLSSLYLKHTPLRLGNLKQLVLPGSTQQNDDTNVQDNDGAGDASSDEHAKSKWNPKTYIKKYQTNDNAAADRSGATKSSASNSARYDSGQGQPAVIVPADANERPETPAR